MEEWTKGHGASDEHQPQEEKWQYSGKNEEQWLHADEDAEELRITGADYDIEGKNSLYASADNDDDDDDDLEDEDLDASDANQDWGNVDPQGDTYDPDMDPTAPGSAV